MKRRGCVARLLMVLALIIPTTALSADDRPVIHNEKQVQETAPKLTEEDRQVVEMLDLLEILELLNEFDNVTALEEKP